jgi:hypothetical protein
MHDRLKKFSLQKLRKIFADFLMLQLRAFSCEERFERVTFEVFFDSNCPGQVNNFKEVIS